MSCGHARTNSNVENVANGSSRTVLKRSLDYNNKFCPKEREVPGLALKNTEQRCSIFILVALDLDAYWKLAPFLPPFARG